MHYYKLCKECPYRLVYRQNLHKRTAKVDVVTKYVQLVREVIKLAIIIYVIINLSR